MTDILITKKNVIYDATVLSTLMSCPRYTDFRFNLNLVPIKGKSRSLEMGSIVHKVLEVYYDHIIKHFPRQMAIDNALIAGQEYADNPDEVVNLSKEDKQLALKTCEEYFEYYKSDHWIPLEVEVVKGEVIYEDDEIRVLWKAKFDEIVDTNQGIFPVDHKSYSQRRDTLTLNNQFIGQCILAKTRMMFVNKIGFQTSLKASEKFLRVPINYSLDRLNEWKDEIVPYYAKLHLMYQESGYYPPNFTHCENKWGFCMYKDVCESNRNMREEVLRNEFKISEIWDPSND